MKEHLPARLCAFFFCREFTPATDGSDAVIRGVLTEIPAETESVSLVVVMDNGDGPRSMQPVRIAVVGPDGTVPLPNDGHGLNLGANQFEVIGLKLHVGAMFCGRGHYLISLENNGRTLASRRLTLS